MLYSTFSPLSFFLGKVNNPLLSFCCCNIYNSSATKFFEIRLPFSFGLVAFFVFGVEIIFLLFCTLLIPQYCIPSVKQIMCPYSFYIQNILFSENIICWSKIRFSYLFFMKLFKISLFITFQKIFLKNSRVNFI